LQEVPRLLAAVPWRDVIELALAAASAASNVKIQQL